MKVTKWTHWDNNEYLDFCESNVASGCKQTVIEHLKNTGIRFCSDYHQNGQFGVPIVDDKYKVECTIRCFAAMEASADGSNTTYLDYYINYDGEQKLPPDVVPELC